MCVCACFSPRSKTSSYLEAIIGPAAELHHAGLLVEWEILDVHLTGGMVNSRRSPLDLARVHQSSFCGQGHLEVAVSTAKAAQSLSTCLAPTYCNNTGSIN